MKRLTNEILSASGEWGDPADASCYEAVNKLEQDFVDVVRATGGNNEFRDRKASCRERV